MPISLPAVTFLGESIIPYAPNAPGDRGHTWDWPGHLDTAPSGLTTASVTADQGTEAIALGFVGLTRAEATALESFVATQQGRKSGFWCPTFQHDFYVVTGGFTVRDWGYRANLFDQQNNAGVYWARFWAITWQHLWCIGRFNGSVTDPGAFDSTGARLITFATDSGHVGSDTPLGKSTPEGAAAMRLLWVRFADDAMTTEWTHPHLASITLRVQHIRHETPVP